MASVPRMKAEVGVYGKTHDADMDFTIHRPHRLYYGTLASYLGRSTFTVIDLTGGSTLAFARPFTGIYTVYLYASLCAKLEFSPGYMSLRT